MTSVAHYIPTGLMPTSDEREDLVAAMAEAKKEREKAEKLEDAFESSAIYREASSKPIFTATVRNFDCNLSPLDIVDYFTRYGVAGILRCELKTPNAKMPKKKVAIISVATQTSLDILLGLSSTRWGRFTLLIQEEKDPKFQALVRDEFTISFNASLMHILPSREGSEYFEACFTTSSNVVLTCSGRGSYPLAITFGSTKLELKISQIEECTIGTTTDGECVVWFKLYHPPMCYKQTKQNPFDNMMDELFSAHDSLQWILAGTNIDNGTLWEANEIASRALDWERSVDPTPNKILGKYLCYQLTLPKDSPSKVLKVLRKFGLEYIAYTSTIQTPLKQASSRLLPEADWSGGFDHLLAPLSFAMRYALQVLLTHHYIVFSHANQVATLVARIQSSKVRPEDIVRLCYRRRANAWNKLLKIISEATQASSKYEKVQATSNCIQIRRVLIAPLRVIVEPPEPDLTNRVVRLYEKHIDRFIRATFVDDDYGSVHQVKYSSDIAKRFKSIVQHGVYIAGEHFEFLGYSSSQLREQSCWFYRKPSANEAPTVRDIHNSLGNFLAIPTAGKRGARLGQAFSTTTSTVEVPSSQIIHLPDIKYNGYCFSDGIGVISQALATRVAAKLGINYTPSAFQIRYGGYKGMVSVHPSTELYMALRPSMKKFESNHCHLEICSVPGRMPCYLNRQSINILSSLGIPDSSFLNLYEAMISDLDRCFDSNEAAKRMVFEHDQSSLIAKLLDAGVGIDDRHVYEWLSVMRSRLLLNVQLKARIIVPQGVNLVGVLDETDSLPEGCVFFKSNTVKPPPNGTIVAVGRCPCLHPGDIRRLKFVERPELAHLNDVLVFSAIGERPETDKMAGGDLDGDIYFCTWDPSLVPEYNYPAMIPEIPAAAQNLNYCADSMEVVGDFYVDYLMKDNLGQIANMHVVICDRFSEGARHEFALKFAQAHSIAVDFAKTGIPAQVPKLPIRLMYPDFMENKNKASYESQRILGKLYRLSKSTRLKEPTCSINQNVNMKILRAGYKDYLEDASECFYYYSNALYDVAYRYEIESEIELISGYIRKMSRKVCRMKGLKSTEDVMERIRFAVSRVQKEYRDIFWSDFAEGTKVDDEEVLKKASAWYYCAYTYLWPDGYPPYLSFAWLATEPMCALFRKAHTS